MLARTENSRSPIPRSPGDVVVLILTFLQHCVVHLGKRKGKPSPPVSSRNQNAKEEGKWPGRTGLTFALSKNWARLPPRDSRDRGRRAGHLTLPSPDRLDHRMRLSTPTSRVQKRGPVEATQQRPCRGEVRLLRQQTRGSACKRGPRVACAAAFLCRPLRGLARTAPRALAVLPAAPRSPSPTAWARFHGDSLHPSPCSHGACRAPNP